MHIADHVVSGHHAEAPSPNSLAKPPLFIRTRSIQVGPELSLKPPLEIRAGSHRWRHTEVVVSETYSRHLIRIARRQSGLTQQALAELAGTSQAAISAYESGRRSPSVDTLCRILGAAGFEVRMRLAAPDTHEAARAIAESLLSSDQLAAHSEVEHARVNRRKAHA
jgi:transcriptional regulator with XRE-family HTH domain